MVILSALVSVVEAAAGGNLKATAPEVIRPSDITPLRFTSVQDLNGTQMNSVRNSTIFVDKKLAVSAKAAGTFPRNPSTWVDSVGWYPDARSLATDTSGVLYVIIHERKGPAEERKFTLRNFTLKDGSTATVNVVRTVPALIQPWIENGVKVGSICYWNTGYYYNPNIMAELYFNIDTWWGEQLGTAPWAPIMTGGRVYMP